MKDMSAPAAASQEWCGGVVERGVERDLGLHAGDAVDSEPVLALEIFDQRGQRRIEAIVRWCRRPADRSRVAGCRAASFTRASRAPSASGCDPPAAGSPQQDVVAEPAARQIAYADLALRAAEVDLRVLVIETGEHQLVRAALSHR